MLIYILRIVEKIGFIKTEVLVNFCLVHPNKNLQKKCVIFSELIEINLFILLSCDGTRPINYCDFFILRIL